MRPLAIALAVLATIAVGAAQTVPKESSDKGAAKPPFVFEAGQIEVTELIRRCAAYLQRNILFDDGELMSASTGQRARPRRQGGARPAAAAAAAETEAAGPVVTLDRPVVTDRDGCEELLSSLLWMHGLALVPLDEPKAVYEVLSMQGPRAREVMSRSVQRTPEQVLARPTLRQFVTVVLKLEHTNATVANNALRPFFAMAGGQMNGQGPGLTLGNVGNSTSMVVSGPQNLVANALLLLRAADVPDPAQAPDLEAKINTLIQQNSALAQRISVLEQRLAKR